MERRDLGSGRLGPVGSPPQRHSRFGTGPDTKFVVREFVVREFVLRESVVRESPDGGSAGPVKR